MARYESTYDIDVRKALQSLKAVEKQAREADKVLKDAGKKSGDSFKKGAREAERAWDRSGRRIERSMTSLRRLVGAVFAAETIRRFGTALVGVNNEMEQLRVRFTSLTGSAWEADRVLSQIQKFAQSKGLAFSPLAQGVQTMTSFGLELETVLENLEAISSAAILSPDGMQQGFNRIGRALGQIAGNGRLAAEEMNQLSEAGLPAWRLLSQELGKSTGELRKLTEEGKLAADAVVPALLDAIRKEYPTLLRDYSRSAEGLANRFAEVFRKALTQVGGPTFAEFGRDLQSLADSLDAADSSGSLTRSLRETGMVLRDIYRVLVDIAKVIAPLTPELLRLGTSFLIFKGLQFAIRNVKELTDGVLKYAEALHLAGRRAQAVMLGRAAPLYTTHQPPKPSSGGGTSLNPYAKHFTVVSGAEILKAFPDATRRQIEERARVIALMGSRAEKASGAFARMGLHIKKAGVYVKSVAGQAFRSLSAILGGWPGIIAAVVTALVALSARFDLFGKLLGETSRKIREHRKEIKNLLDDIDVLDARMKGQRLFELTIKVSELQADVDKMLGGLPEKVRYAINKAIADGTLEGLGDLMTQNLQTVQNAGGNPTLDPSGTANVARLRRYGLSAGDLTPEIRKQIAAFIELHSIFAEASRAEDELHSDMNKNYHTQLAYLTAVEEQLSGIVGRTAEEEARLKRVRAEIERINKLLAPPSEGSGGGSLPSVTAGGSEDERTIMTVEELARAMELLDAYDELRGKLGEIHRIEEQIENAQKDVAQLRKVSPSDPRIKDYEELIQLLGAEKDYLTENYNQSYRNLELYKELPEAARKLIDELGGIDELFEQGVSEEALKAFLPSAQQMQTYMRQLETTLADIRKNTDLSLIDEQTSKTMAAAAAETFRIQLVEFLEEIDLESLPGALRDHLQTLIQEMAGQIGGARRGDDLPKQLKDSAESVRSLVGAGRSLLGLARSLGKVSDAAADVATGLLDAGASMADLIETRKRLKEDETSLSSTKGILAQLPGFVGVAAGLGSVIGGLLSASKAEREEMKRLQAALRESAREIRRAVEETFKAPQLGSSLQRGTLLEAQQVLRSLQRGGNSIDAATELVQRLEDSGISLFSGISETFRTLLNTIIKDNVRELGRGKISAEQLVNRAVRELFGERFGNLDAALEELINRQGEYSKTVAGAATSFEFLTKYLGEETPEAFRKFIKSLLSVEGIDEDLRPLLVEAMGLDLTTEAGRRRVEELRKTIAADLQTYLGKLSPEEIERILDSFIQAEQDASSAGLDDGWTTSIGQLRQITDAQGDEMITVLKEIAHWTRIMATRGIGDSTLAKVPQMAIAPMVPHLKVLQAPAKALSTSVNVTVGSLSVGSERDIPGLAVLLEKEIRKHLNRQFGRK